VLLATVTPAADPIPASVVEKQALFIGRIAAICFATQANHCRVQAAGNYRLSAHHSLKPSHGTQKVVPSTDDARDYYGADANRRNKRS
jgi:hypothetical protein